MCTLHLIASENLARKKDLLTDKKHNLTYPDLYIVRSPGTLQNNLEFVFRQNKERWRIIIFFFEFNILLNTSKHNWSYIFCTFGDFLCTKLKMICLDLFKIKNLNHRSKERGLIKYTILIKFNFIVQPLNSDKHYSLCNSDTFITYICKL